MDQGFESVANNQWSIFDLPDDQREASIVMLKYAAALPDTNIAVLYGVEKEVAAKQINIDHQAVRERVMGKISMAWLDGKIG